MSERNPKLDSFYKCKYGFVRDNWEINKRGKSFEVTYTCEHPEVKGPCIELYGSSNKNCPYKKIKENFMIL